jgi:uncharacterized protein involved in copper resistance
MTTRLLVAALAATASLAACGGGEKPTSSGASARDQNRKAMLDFARCMREHGVDMPDPQFDGGRMTMKRSGDSDPEKMRAADKACQPILAKVKPPEMSPQKQEELKRAALANARCMREHGIDNFPDPTFDENGGAQIRIGGKGTGIDPESPKFKAAQKACESTMPAFGKTDMQEGGR